MVDWIEVRDMHSRRGHIGLYWYIWAVVLATLVLMYVGSVVTTKDVGLAVPDWPLSFGSVNPPGWWEIEGVKWEHGHRLMGAIVGIMVIGLFAWIWIIWEETWMRVLGGLALLGVIIQGLMGGFRVIEISTFLAVVHGCFAQLFLGLLIVLAALNSPYALAAHSFQDKKRLVRARSTGFIFLAAAFIQIILGAATRHLKAALAIPDFPKSLGQWIPEFINYGVTIHYMHRVWALAVVLIGIGWVVSLFRGETRGSGYFRWRGVVVLLLLGVQIWLGAFVVWKLREVLPTTLHVLNGVFLWGWSVYMVTRLSMVLASLQNGDDRVERGINSSEGVEVMP